jgi:hypothetical protein
MKYGEQAKSRGAQSMLVLFLPNSKRAVSIMSFYGHRRVSFHEPLIIVRSLAHNIYKF